jgi:hypothetical protein
MTSRFFLRGVALAAALVAVGSPDAANAHISYSNRNFGTWTTGSGWSVVNGLLDAGAVTIGNQTVSSSFGWADASDVSWGDSHRMRGFRFSLASPGDVTITAQRQTVGGQTGAADTLLPGISLYSGLSHTSSPLAHDHSSLSVEWLIGQFGSGGVAEAFSDDNLNLEWDPGESFTDDNGNGVWDSAGLGDSGKEGSFNALGDWSIGNSLTDYPTASSGSDTLRSLVYVGHAVDGSTANYGTFGTTTVNGDGLADGLVSWTFSDLPIGDYTIMVGGADYSAQLLEGPTTFPTYGMSLTVSAVPEPTSMALVAAGVAGGGMVLARRRRR